MPGVNSMTPVISSQPKAAILDIDLDLLFVQLMLGEQASELVALDLGGALGKGRPDLRDQRCFARPRRRRCQRLDLHPTPRPASAPELARVAAIARLRLPLRRSSRCSIR